ncbi:MAG: ATP-binding protein [Acidimicrobiales bacterium]
MGRFTRPFERYGLRTRITLAFAFGGLLLSVIIALTTLTLTRQNLLSARDDTSFAVVRVNAPRVQNQLTPVTDEEGRRQILDSLSRTASTFPLLRIEDQWTPWDGQVFAAEMVPSSLLELVDSGVAGRMRTEISGRPAILTGIPLAPVEDRQVVYFEAFVLDDVEDTLDALAVIVFGVAAAATLLSAALGSWAARRTLTPLVEVRTAAESLAAGDLDTRLDPPADADLASLSASFNEMAQALEDRIERDARFASEVSHELRSPLMTLTASLEVLNNNATGLSNRSRTALDLLTDDLNRFNQLVEDLLEISRYDVGTAALQAEAIEVVEFVRQAVGHTGIEGVIVSAEPSIEGLVIMADKRRLGQVVANLLENAAKYGSGPIEVSIERHLDRIRLSVQDEGPGVAPHERLVIFDRFSRGQAGRRRGQDTGSGLGLALVAEHVGLHGGRIWVDSRRDGRSGARFLVELPTGDPR